MSKEIKKLSEKIEKDLDDGKHIEKLKVLKKQQSEQLEELKKLEKLKKKMEEKFSQDSGSDDEQQQDEEKPSLKEKLLKEIKLPILIVLLYVIISHPKCSEVLNNNVPYLDQDPTGLAELVIKGLVLALVVYMITIFLK